jgi:hypothetical protein
LAGIACAIAAVDGAITHNFAAYLVLGFGGGSLIGFLVLAALFSLYVRVAERHSLWLAGRRANAQRAINETIARHLFGWRWDMTCDGEIDFNGHCEKCNQDNLDRPMLSDSHLVEPLDSCNFLNAAFYVIGRLSEMKARVRFNTLARDNFTVTIKSRYTSVVAEDWGYSISEAIARTAAAYGESEEGFIRDAVEYLQGKRVEELRKQMSHEMYAEPFTRSVKLFARTLLEEEGNAGLPERLAFRSRAAATRIPAGARSAWPDRPMPIRGSCCR